jgi:hypothetical protein
MILWRGQNATNPTESSIVLQKTFFVRGETTYRFTDDLSHSSLASILTVAGANGSGIWKYPDFKASLSQSQFPPHFYTVE